MVTMEHRNRKLNYPSPHYDNLRLFSIPLNNKLFLAVVYRKPHVSQYFTFNSKASFNGFSLPHTQTDDLDTDFKYFTKQDLISSTFTPQNVVLNRKNDIEFEVQAGVSPPRVNPSWEENIFAQFSDGSSPPGSPFSQNSSAPSFSSNSISFF